MKSDGWVCGGYGYLALKATSSEVQFKVNGVVISHCMGRITGENVSWYCNGLYKKGSVITVTYDSNYYLNEQGGCQLYFFPLD